MDTKELLLAKYFAGTCNREELERLFHFLKTDTSANYTHIMAEIWEQIETVPELDSSDSARILSQIKDQIAQSEVPVPALHHTASPHTGRRYAWISSIAASLLLLAAVAITQFWGNSIKSITHHTEFGETRTIVLPDSSRVVLNGNSTLRYPSTFEGDSTREVWLEGEAFFDVERKAAQNQRLSRFIVHAGQVQVEVLGTEFNVNDRRNRTQVVLHEGKVKIHRKQAEDLTLNPGDLVELSGEKNDLVHKTVNSEDYFSWTESEWVFDNSPLSDIAEKLHDINGLEVEFTDESLKSLAFTGRSSSQDMDLLIEILERSFEIRVARSGNRLTISPRN